ncbi:RluA family pseudouridine synthase [Sediminicola luteus]|uniref:RNA pseudouridine synthase n=1 Tax=Sediminicola luteus TaxID=319238 RepID=A0A2A4G3D8_9FLAO|nr:RluA family pseudouridine synthase [Sediminicola luteus]PCE62476.1 RNA pseudouridine synthase [Sediminicola luteus]
MATAPPLVHRFQKAISNIPLPERFTFPFYYDPHPLSLMAAKALQDHLATQSDFDHNFGLDPMAKGMVIGKMFGVLVIKDTQGKLGYLWAFSGKLAEQNHWPGFVPPIFDMLDPEGFFKQEEFVLNQINAQIEEAGKDSDYIKTLNQWQAETQLRDSQLSAELERLKTRKRERRAHRNSFDGNVDQREALQQAHHDQSLKDQFVYKEFQAYWYDRIRPLQIQKDQFEQRLERLRKERKTRSNALQQRLFDQYHFLDANGNTKNVLDVFEGVPPAGSGECAAPKLLQYAYTHGLQPLALAEFWWGAPPNTEIRQHSRFYPSCKSKCEPILGHMLQGLQVDPDPLLQNPALGKDLEILFEDEAMLVINKPAEFLSVPGKHITDSVQSRMKAKYSEASGPMVVHRLDMSTSGLMLIAKTEKAHKRLQKQFLDRTIKKQYIALLDGEVSEPNGVIELPLRVDLDDRPRQLICYDHGKPAKTLWETMAVTNGQTRIRFIPITGRTHQLRVHTAHQSGLGCPIVGDDLYGTKADRLHLHAAYIAFTHPLDKKEMVFEKKPDF